MAPAKSKKPAAKKAAAKPVKAAPGKTAVAPTKPVEAEVLPTVTSGKKRGRPAGSSNKSTRKASGKGPGRAAATEFLYILREPAQLDEMGIPDASEPVEINVRGPFASEEAAQTAAIAEIGANANLEVTLFRDYKRGKPEFRVRLI